MTSVEGNASVYQVYPVSRITCEGRAELIRAWGPGFEQEGAGGEDEGVNSICAWKLYIISEDKSDGFGRNAPVYHVYPVSRTASEERAECSRGPGGGGQRVFNSFGSHRCNAVCMLCATCPQTYPVCTTADSPNDGQGCGDSRLPEPQLPPSSSSGHIRVPKERRLEWAIIGNGALYFKYPEPQINSIRLLPLVLGQLQHCVDP